MNPSESLSREVSSLPLAPSIVDNLILCGFRKVSDLQTMQPLDLARELNITVESSCAILQCVESSKKVNTQFTAMELMKSISHERLVITFCRAIDQMLGGGIPLQQVTEICGVPGIGKTQLGIQLALDVQIPAIFKGCGGESIYIDTEGSFMIERAVEMSDALSNHLKRISTPRGNVASTSCSTEAQLAAAAVTREKLLEGIQVFRPYDSTELLAITQYLAAYLKLHTNVKIIIIDSIAFLFRQELTDSSVRNRVLSSLAQTLQSIAFEFNIAVVVMNHVVTKFDKVTNTPTIVPALGVQWSHSITNRLMLTWQGDARVASLVKCPSRPINTVAFQVVAEGIRDYRPVDSHSDNSTNNSNIRKRKSSE